MATFLTTARMSPELAARVEASVRGQRVVASAKLKARSVSLLRLGLLAGLVAGAGWGALLWQRRNQELTRERAALLEKIDRESLRVSAVHKKTPDRVLSWLTRSLEPYSGDIVVKELREPDELANTLARPLLYIRGQQGALVTESGLFESARTSTKDAFVLCLLDPPPSRSEKALIGRVRSAYAAGKRMHERAGHVERLFPALVTLPFLARDFRARVVEAENMAELGELQRLFDRAPLDRARAALEAEVLLFVIDEPATTNRAAELDGERPHPVRVGLVDLGTDRLLLRTRRNVDPSWLSDTARAEFASGVDGCSLALDVRALVSDDSPTQAQSGR